MSKILAVFGASGQQGGSVVQHVLQVPDLSQEYKIRAITRNIDTTRLKDLQHQIEVVRGDAQDRASLDMALTGVHTVFIMTTPSFGTDALEAEYSTAKMIADVSVEKGVKYIIFSTLPAVRELSGGRLTNITPFDAKAKAEQYIRGLNVQSAFVSLGSFMENFQSQPFLAPRKAFDGTYIFARHVSPMTQWPLLDAVGDTGKFVGAILAEPDKYEGITFCAATRFYSLEEIVEIMSKATGKTIRYQQVSAEEFKKSLTMIPEVLADILVEGLKFQEELDYFGPGGEEAVAWAVENARGKLSTFEEYLEAHPLTL